MKCPKCLNDWPEKYGDECPRCDTKMDSKCPSDAAACSPSSDTEAFKKEWPESRRHNWPCTFESDAFAKLATTERQRDEAREALRFANRTIMDLNTRAGCGEHPPENATVDLPPKEGGDSTSDVIGG